MEKNISDNSPKPEKIIKKEKPSLRDSNYLDNHMKSLLIIVEEDIKINLNLPQKNNLNYIINEKYLKEKKLLKIFVSLPKDTELNPRDSDIDFLFLINKEFPSKPPMVFCLSDVRFKFFFYI